MTTKVVSEKENGIISISIIFLLKIEQFILKWYLLKYTFSSDLLNESHIKKYINPHSVHNPYL